MIFSSIKNGDSFEKYPAAIQTALEYLKSHDFAAMDYQLNEIQGKDIYAQVFDAMTEDVADRRPESHEKYLDVLFLVSGKRTSWNQEYRNYKAARGERDHLLWVTSQR